MCSSQEAFLRQHVNMSRPGKDPNTFPMITDFPKLSDTELNDSGHIIEAFAIVGGGKLCAGGSIGISEIFDQQADLQDISSRYPGRFSQINDIPEQEFHPGRQPLVLAQLLQSGKRGLEFDLVLGGGLQLLACLCHQLAQSLQIRPLLDFVLILFDMMPSSIITTILQ